MSGPVLWAVTMVAALGLHLWLEYVWARRKVRRRR